jgi:hypothetical protein
MKYTPRLEVILKELNLSIPSSRMIYWAIFSRIAQLSQQYGKITLPILISRKDNAGVVIENVCIVTRVGI